MGQQEIIEVLKKNHNQWLSASQINILLGKSKDSSIHTPLNKLRRYKNIIKYKLDSKGFFVYKIA